MRRPAAPKTELDPARTDGARNLSTGKVEIWEAASLAAELIDGQPVPVWTYERIEDASTWWHVHRCDWPASKFEVFSKLPTAQNWTYRQDERHVAETITPEDGRFVVDCSCGRSYDAPVGGMQRDHFGPGEHAALLHGQDAHERKCRA